MLRNIWIALVEQIFFSVNVFIFCSHLIMMNWFRIVRQSISFISNGIFFSSLTWKIFFSFSFISTHLKKGFQIDTTKIELFEFSYLLVGVVVIVISVLLVSKTRLETPKCFGVFQGVESGINTSRCWRCVIFLRRHHFKVSSLWGVGVGWKTPGLVLTPWGVGHVMNTKVLTSNTF